jgi:hypothetical protein
MTPAEGPRGADTPVTITGDSFWLLGHASFAAPGGSQASAAFAAFLGDTPLGVVAYVDEHTLTATVPATLAAGAYDLRVVDPAGREGTLAAAFTVLAPCATAADCDDGDACNGAETCDAAQACRPGTALVCDDGNPCTADTCDGVLGCVAPAAPDGTSCDDGDACSGPDACAAGACGGPPLCAGVTPPVARFVVTPGAAATGATFAFDASPTADIEDADAALTFEWDWNGDGLFDDTGLAPTHAFAAAALTAVTLRVTDSTMLADDFVGWVVVTAPPGPIVVTTGADVVAAADGVTSLREAFALAQGAPGADVITFSGPMTVVLATGVNLSDVDPVTVVGIPGVIVDGTAVPGINDCLSTTTPGASFLWLEVEGCGGAAIGLYGDGGWVALCSLHDNGYAGVYTVGDMNVAGPGNLLFANIANGAYLRGVGSVLDGNEIYGNGSDGVYVGNMTDLTVVRRNVIRDNGGNGILVASAIDNNTVWHNTIDGNTLSGFSCPANSNANDVRNNVFSNNGGWGVSAGAASFASAAFVDYNDFFSNALGAWSGGARGASSLLLDPIYVDAAARDLRLYAASPCVDAGLDLGLDVNGSAPALFDGAAPDLGASEVP